MPGSARRRFPASALSRPQCTSRFDRSWRSPANFGVVSVTARPAMEGWFCLGMPRTQVLARAGLDPDWAIAMLATYAKAYSRAVH